MKDVELEAAHAEASNVAHEMDKLRQEVAAQAELQLSDGAKTEAIEKIQLQCAEFRGETAKVTALNESLVRKLETAHEEVGKLKKLLNSESRRAIKADEASQEARTARVNAEAELSALRAAEAGRPTAEEAEALQAELRKMKEMYQG